MATWPSEKLARRWRGLKASQLAKLRRGAGKTVKSAIGLFTLRLAGGVGG
jgi:hypothetical protein